MGIGRFALAALLALALAVPAQAQGQGGGSGIDDSIVTDRPDFTESTSTLPPGHFQIEGGTTVARVEEEDSTSFGELLVRVGMGEMWEARLGIGSYSRIETPLADFTGFEDPSVGLKVRFTEAADQLAPGQPAMALIFLTSIPAGDEDLTDDEWVPEAKLALGWSLSSRFSLGSNVNYAYAVDGDDRFHQLSGSLTSGFSITDRVGSYLEWFGFLEEIEDGPSTHYVNGGVTYLVNNDLQVDARVGTGLNDADPDWFVGVGAAIRW
ncbi:MAG TPA: transporter [Thermoanaerobaculia bacterium]|nr:transporter [Thermoanaerobaculia bacterium]